MATADALLVLAPIDGLVVPRTVWKPGGSGPGEPEEGDEIWPGIAVLDIVSPRAMRVRVKANQVDVHHLVVGRPARITLDAYPNRSYPGRLRQVSPIATHGAFAEGPHVHGDLRHRRAGRRDRAQSVGRRRPAAGEGSRAAR